MIEKSSKTARASLRKTMGSSTMMTQKGLVAEVDRLLHDNRPNGIKPEIIVDDPAIDLTADPLVRNMIVDVVIPNLFTVGTHNGDDLQAPSKDSRPPPAVRSVPGNQEGKNSSPMPGSNRATNKVGQPPAAPNTSSHHATQTPAAPGATARDEAQPDPQVYIRQAHVVDASAKGGVASAIGSTRDIDAGVYNASVHNEQHNLFRVESAEFSGSEEGEILE
ncbi:unnamed protein product [Alternaria alternata]